MGRVGEYIITLQTKWNRAGCFGLEIYAAPCLGIHRAVLPGEGWLHQESETEWEWGLLCIVVCIVHAVLVKMN